MNILKKNGYSRTGIILLCSLVYFVSYFSRKDFAAVMAGMFSEGAVGRSTAGLVGTIMFACYGAGQLISGYLGDRIKPKHLIITGLLTTGVCNALMPIVTEGLMIAIWGVNGLAQAMLWPPIVKILSQHLDHKTYVTANLVVTSAAHVATILLYVFVPICLSFMSWKAVFFTASVLAIASVVVFAVGMRAILPPEATAQSTDVRTLDPLEEHGSEPRETEADQESRIERRSLISTLRDSGLITIFISIIACGFLRDGIESWLPTLYSEAFARDASESILVSVILPIFSIISISVITAFHKKRIFSNEVTGSAILFAASAILTIPLVFFVRLDGMVFAVISLVLTALICAAMHGVNFLLISCLPGRFAGAGRAATVGGVCNSCVYVGAAISTYGIALISESFGWSLTVATWIALCIIGIVFAVISHNRYTRMIQSKNDK